jgi:hypothetical protein
MNAILKCQQDSPHIHSTFTAAAADELLRVQRDSTHLDPAFRLKMDGMLSPFTRKD